jgi:hypothetical protein
LGSHFSFVDPTIKGRHINGTLGLLLKENFPGLVTYKGRREPAYSFRHYEQATEEGEDQDGRHFANKAERVVEELWVSFQSSYYHDV